MTTQTLRTDPSSAVEIRAAGPEDAPLVHQMVLEIGEHENSLDSVEVDVTRWQQMLTRGDVHVLIASCEGVAAGYVSATRRLQLWLGTDIVALDDLYVRPRFRNLGLGQELMAALARLAAPNQMLIRWEMLEDNYAAQRFYRRLGATLRTKVIATWPSSAYEAAAGSST